MADKPHITPAGYVTRLVQVGVWATPHNPIQYAFLEQKPFYLPNEAGWTPFSAAQRAAVQQAFAMIAEVVNLTFVQVADNQQQPGPGNPRINFYANSMDLAYSGSMNAYQFGGSDAIHGADIRFNTARIAQRQSNEGFQDFTSFVALHEVLHAMGLSHPGNYNGQGFNYQDHAEFVEDTVQYSAMSYFSAAQAGADHFIGNVLYAARTPLLYDILALQSLYAPNMTTRAGDTVYGFNSNTGANSPFNFAVTTGPVVAIWDGGGIDTIDLSGYSDASLINLNEGEFSDAGGLTKNIAIAFGVTIENAVGGAGDDVIYGNLAANRLAGGAGNDLLDGGGGADLLDGGTGADQMDGGPGDDIYVVDTAGDQIFDSGGIDTVRTTTELPLLNDALENLELLGNAAINGVGNAQANIIVGNDAANQLDGRGGDDRMIGGGGDDSFVVDSLGDVAVEQAGGGNDEIRFETGFSAAAYTLPDHVEQASVFGAAIGRLVGNASDNLLLGDVADDHLDGGAGIDTLRGGAGDDFYYLDQSGDVVEENASEGIDTVQVAFAAYTLGANLERLHGIAPAGGQALTGNALANIIIGGAGNDAIDGGLGADQMAGGLGDDVYVVDNGGDSVVELAGEGIDEIRASLASYSIAGLANVEDLTGLGAIDHVLTGNGLANTIRGDNGLDVIDGGAGGDLMAGGFGNDVYFVDDQADAVTELAGQGDDEVRTAAAAYTLAAEVERLTGLSNLGQSLTGNGLANVITGDTGNDVIDGGLGADVMAGGLGNDIYVIDHVNDLATDSGGVDRVLSAVTYVLGNDIEDLTLTGAAAIDGTGNGSANSLTGNSAANLLDGGLGADAMAGGLGNDVYILDNAGDSVTELAGQGSDEVRTALASFSIAALANIENLTGTSGAGQTLTGNGSNNVIAAGTGNDLIDGGAGADSMSGGLGDDVFFVDSLGDSVVELGGGGTDEVRTALAAYALAGEVERLTGTTNAGQALTGNGLANLIMAGWGSDLIDGGLGADDMRGSLGNDVYLVDNAGDTVTEGDSQGLDEVRTNLATYSLAGVGHVENLTGGAGDQSLTGNGHNNIIDGGLGADTMAGGGGHDVYIVDNLGDTIIEVDGAGTDEVRTGLGSKAPPERAVYVLPAFIENLTGTSAGAQGVRDNALSNVITMGVGHDLVVADAGGIDTINAGIGNDFVYYGDKLTAADITNGGAGSDTVALLGNYGGGITFTAANLVGVERMALYTSLYLPGTGPNNYTITMNDANVAAGTEFFVTAASLQSNESLTFSGAAETDGRFTIHGGGGADTITGGAGGDFVLGNAGNDILFGLGGVDFLIGGLGADQLSGGAGVDRFVYQNTAQSTAGNVDSILDFQHGDRIDLTGIDANGNAGDGNSAFTFIGSDAFGNVAGQLRAYQSGADWFVEGDVNGDGLADLVIQVTLPDATPLGAGDFFL